MKTGFVMMLATLLLLSGCNGSSPGADSPGTVVSDSDNAGTVSKNFTVDSCSDGVLEYSGSEIDPEEHKAWVTFRIYDSESSDDAVVNSAILNLEPTGSGSIDVTLDPGTYYVEVKSANSAWEYSIRCP